TCQFTQQGCLSSDDLNARRNSGPFLAVLKGSEKHIQRERIGWCDMKNSGQKVTSAAPELRVGVILGVQIAKRYNLLVLLLSTVFHLGFLENYIGMPRYISVIRVASQGKRTTADTERPHGRQHGR
ncbi:hypothetical protein BaRGS_00032900, partial [Batillaria attramentaria]